MTDEESGIQYITTTKNISSNAKLSVKDTSENSEIHSQVQYWLDDSVKYWDGWIIDVVNESGGSLSVTQNGQLNIPIPSEYDTSLLRVYRLGDEGTWLNEITNYTIENGCVVISANKMGTYVLAQDYSTNIDGSDLDDGTYTVDVTVWHMTMDQSSMASQAVVSSATLVVDGDEKTLYLDFKSVGQTVGDQGFTGYMTDMWVYDS